MSRDGAKKRHERLAVTCHRHPSARRSPTIPEFHPLDGGSSLVDKNVRRVKPLERIVLNVSHHESP
jgi:hypothetical protein